MAVRLREPVALLDPSTGAHTTPFPNQYFDEDDPLVRAHPWAFATDDELARAQAVPAVESVEIERATRRPGEKRTTRRGQ